MFNYFFIPSHISAQNYQNINYPEDKTDIRLKNSYQIDSLQKKYGTLKKKYKELLKEKDALKLQIEELEANQPEIRKRKFRRRSQQELQRNYKCQFDSCLKQYASQLALNLHMRGKHNAGTKKQRFAATQSLIEAEQKGEPVPYISINLPPNYIEEYQNVLEAQKEKSQFFQS